jgi:hypothetical protein
MVNRASFIGLGNVQSNALNNIMMKCVRQVSCMFSYVKSVIKLNTKIRPERKEVWISMVFLVLFL